MKTFFPRQWINKTYLNISDSWLNFSLRSNDAKAIFNKKKKNGFLTENFYCKCFIVFYFFFAEDGP